MPGTLDEVLGILRSRHFADNERALGAILTRVALRTGADLRAPRPDQRANPAVIANVLAVLQVMGYVVQPAGTDAIQMIIGSQPHQSESSRWWSRRGASKRRSAPGTYR